jgi:hypothetical protein
MKFTLNYFLLDHDQDVAIIIIEVIQDQEIEATQEVELVRVLHVMNIAMVTQMAMNLYIIS